MSLPRVSVLLPLLLLLAGCPLQNVKEAGEGKEATPARDMNQVLDEARAAYTEGDWKLAEQDYLLVVQKDPSSFEAWFRLGNIYTRSDRPDLATQAYREALLRRPDDARAWHNLSVIHLRQAINSLEQMQRYADPDDPMSQSDRRLLEGLRRLVTRP